LDKGLPFIDIVFTGKEPNKALGLSSLKPEDCIPEWEDLDETGQKTLNDWFTFFSKRYNVVGKVQRDTASSL
jgi:membrane-associated progesterone receptor component